MKPVPVIYPGKNEDNRVSRENQELGKLVSISALVSIFLYFLVPVKCMATELSDSGLYVIPYPQKGCYRWRQF